MSVTKSGIITSSEIYESEGTNILLNTEKYTRANPFVLSGSNRDIYCSTIMYNRVTPGKTYYLSCQTDSEWSKRHVDASDAGDVTGKVTIWLYLLKVFDANNGNFDLPVCFTSSNWVEKGIWKYTIPAGYNMARVRFNTYSDGTNQVTCKFWDVRLIPEEYYVPRNNSGGGGEFLIPPHWKNLYLRRGAIRNLSYLKEVI